MNLQQIDYILAVASARSFSKAAAQCYIAQSTLSTMISRFEEEVGVRIFNRRTKPTTVTEEGVAIIDQLRRITAERRMLDEVIRALKDEWSGSLHLGVIPTVAPFLVPRFLPAFAQKLPELKIQVSELQTEAIIEQLRRRTLDVGIAAIPFDAEDLIEVVLYDEIFVGYDCRSQVVPQAPMDIDHLQARNLWLLEHGHCLNTQVRRICGLDADDESATMDRTGRNVDFKSGSIHSLIHFVQAARGVTLLPQLCTLELSASQRAHLRPLKGEVPMRSIGLVTHRDFIRDNLRLRLQQTIQRAVGSLLTPPSDGWVVRPV